MNLNAVPVLAEPESKLTLDTPKLPREGEVREGTQNRHATRPERVIKSSDSCGGVQMSPHGDKILPDFEGFMKNYSGGLP